MGLRVVWVSKRQPLIWRALIFFKALVCFLPHRTALLLGSFLGWCVEQASGRYAQKARARCERILGVSPSKAREIISSSYSHFARAVVEFARSPIMTEKLDELITVHGEEHLRQAYDQGKGVILLSAHIGNWEYAGALLVRHGYAVNAIGADQRDERITQLIASLRESVGVKPLGKGLDLKGAIRCLQRGELLAVLLDQDARDAGVISPFLGFPASTPIGPLKLAHKLGCKVVPGCMIRRQDGVHYDLYLEPALEGKGGRVFGEDLQESADACNEAISRWILKYPGQWLWMYPRWASTLKDR